MIGTKPVVNYDGLKDESRYLPGDRVPYGMGTVTTPGGYETDLAGKIYVSLEPDPENTDETVREFVEEALRYEPYRTTVTRGRGPYEYEEELVIRITKFAILSWGTDMAVVKPLDWEYL